MRHLPCFSAKTRVYDHADSVMYMASRERSGELYQSGRAEIMWGKSGRIRGLRLSGPDPARLPGCASRRTQPGLPHRHEAYDNIRGVWTIDRLPADFRGLFTAVLFGCLRAA